MNSVQRSRYTAVCFVLEADLSVRINLEMIRPFLLSQYEGPSKDVAEKQAETQKRLRDQRKADEM